MSATAGKKISILVAVFLIAAAITAGIIHYSSLPQKPADYLPPQIANHPLVKMATDEEAITITQRSHLGNVSFIADAAIGYYRSGLTIWISQYRNEKIACSETQKMARAMRRFGRGYEKQNSIKVGNTTVRLAYPKGETHYFWSQGKMMFYIAPDALSQNQVKELIKSFQ